MDSEESVREVDAVEFAGDQVGSFTEDRAADLAADDGLFDQDLRVVLPRGLQSAQQLVLAGDLADAE